MSDVVRTIGGMTDDERALLAFEEQNPTNDRRKEAQIRERFGHSWVRYQQRLLRIARYPSAAAEYPVTVRRVLAAADRGHAMRAERRLS